MRLIRTYRVALLVVIALLLAAACGAEADSGEEAAAQPVVQGTLDDAVGKDLRPGFSPTDVTPEEEAQAKVFKAQGWKTDFTMRTVSLSEFRSAQTRDGIPSIDDPVYISPAEAGEWLQDPEPVLVLEIDGDVRAYPLQILLFHEIVNDVVGDMPVAVTYCPLCNSAVVFDRRVGEQVLDFGVSGNLRFSDLVMYDRQTDSWWQQLTGEALVGELAGTQLDFIPAPIVSWEEFKRAHPEGLVLSRETGFQRPYGYNPYTGYDTGRPWLVEAYRDRRLPAMERVVALGEGQEAVAVPFSFLLIHRLATVNLAGEDVVVFHQPGTASAMDRAVIAEGRDVGSANVFRPVVDGRRLTFTATEEGFVDQETGSTWDLFGRAVDGPLEGSRLETVVHGTHFWFAWSSFQPETRVHGDEP